MSATARAAGLPATSATRVLRADRRGSSWPVIVESPNGIWFTKLRGAAQGAGALVAEIIVAELARDVGLQVPDWCIVQLPHGVPCDDPNDELRDLLDRSTGDNVGFALLEGARDLQAAEASSLDPEFAARVLWLDVFVQNFDRTRHNPNIMVRRGRYWLIDHGVALPFHHDWASVTERSPERPYDVSRHLFGWAADRLPSLTTDVVARLTRERLAAAVAQVPSSLLPDTLQPDDLQRRREAYVAFLWKRLRVMSAPETTTTGRTAHAP